MTNENIIDIGDAVIHKPTGEKWLVACNDNGNIYWCGYPFGGYGDASDCLIVRKATGYQKQNLLRELAEKPGNEIPIIRAKARLAEME